MPAILVVDDEPHMADAMVDLADSLGIHAVRATTLDEARAALGAYAGSLVLSLVDKVWERSATAGIEFVVEAKRDYPNIEQVLMTAWPIRRLPRAERERIAAAEVLLVDKTDFDLDEYVRKQSHEGMPRVRPREREHEEVPVMPQAERDSTTPEVSNRVAWARWRLQAVSRQYDTLLDSWNVMAEQLVQQLLAEAGGDTVAVVINGRGYTRAELIEEVRAVSPLGRELVELNVGLNARLTQRMRKATEAGR